MYWRLLSTDPEAAKAVVLGEKPLISDDTTALDPTLLDELISNISTLSSVYHRPPETFVHKLRNRVPRAAAAPAQAQVPGAQFDQHHVAPQPAYAQPARVEADLLGMANLSIAPAGAAAPAAPQLNQILVRSSLRL